MADGIADPRYPAGTGWLVGYVLAAGIGVVVWLTSGEVTLGLVAIAGTAPALGLSLERVLDTRPLTATQRRYVRLLSIAGVVVGALLLLAVLLS